MVQLILFGESKMSIQFEVRVRRDEIDQLLKDLEAKTIDVNCYQINLCTVILRVTSDPDILFARVDGMIDKLPGDRSDIFAKISSIEFGA